MNEKKVVNEQNKKKLNDDERLESFTFKDFKKFLKNNLKTKWYWKKTLIFYWTNIFLKYLEKSFF